MLVDKAPIQSHRSYCVRTHTAINEAPRGTPFEISFDIVDDRGEVLRNFATVHDKIMHVIVVRHDLGEFQHLHPLFSGADGRFTLAQVVLAKAAPYRLFADFTAPDAQRGPDGMPLATAPWIDLHSPGSEYDPEPLPEPRQRVEVGEYAVTATYPDTLRAGTEAQLRFAVLQGDWPVSDLEPYLGANGHAVILREGDLDFLHSHAMDDSVALRAGTLPFMVHFADGGRYRAFVQFQHRGAVQTAAFTLPQVAAAATISPGGHTGH